MGDADQARLSPVSRFFRFLRAHGEAHPKALESSALLLQRQNANSTLNARFITMLSLACVIASLGLMVDSAVTVIGAMLIAPLMKPITALAFGIVTGNGRLALRALLTVGSGILIVLLLAAGSEFVFELRGTTSEILARTRPSLIDLGVAVAAAIAATYAAARSDVADSLPGVAIAVSLVPPLCVTGIGLSVGEWQVAVGSFELFAVNLSAIIFCAGIVFLIDGYGKRLRALPGMLVVTACIGLLAPSLWRSMRALRVDDVSQETALEFLREKYPANLKAHPNDLRELDVIMMDDHVFMYLRIEAPDDVFSKAELDDLYQRLAANLDQPLNLKIQFVLTNEFMLYPYKEHGADQTLYGAGDQIPRR